MRNLQVHWAEGLFLRDHHFQASNRYLEEHFEISNRIDHPYNYGLSACKISEEALANQEFEVSGCKGRTKSGTLIDMDLTHAERRELKLEQATIAPIFKKHDKVIVYVATPSRVMGRPNVAASPSSNGNHRYNQVMLNCDDESAGGNSQEMAFLEPNLKLLFSTDDLKGFDTLPICQLKKNPDGTGAPIIDTEYFPPMLAIECWPDLHLRIFRTIYDMLGDRAEVLTNQILDRRISFDGSEQGDLSRMLKLGAFNEALARMRILAFSKGVHPLVAYETLIWIIGKLSIFSPDRRIDAEIPIYDHDNLSQIFYWAFTKLKVLLDAGPEDLYAQQWFIGAGRGMQVKLEPRWFTSEWSMYLAIDCGDLNPRVVLQHLAQHVDWKMAPSSQVEHVYVHRIEAIGLTLIPQKPRELPAHGNWLYFTFKQDTPYWQTLARELVLALRIRDEHISNLTTLQGSRKIELNVPNNKITLQYCVFAIKKTGKS